MPVAKKHVLITGSTSGIGYELAKLFAADGYNILAVARSPKELEQTASELQLAMDITVHSFQKDLFHPKAACELYNDIKARGIRVDVLVNNAGQGLYGEFVDTELSKELDIIQLNIISLVSLTKLFLRDMVKRGAGKILNVSSVAAKSPGPWQSVYHATKAFVQSFTEAIREEVKDKGVVVTALLPGLTDTDFFRKAEMESSKAVRGTSWKASPSDVARDGYNALMEGKDMVISGVRNKLEAGLDAITSDSKLARQTAKAQKPVKKRNRY